MSQWLRSYSLVVGNGSASTTIQSLAGEPGLRIRFSVKRWNLQTPNNATITITNLSDATAQKISKEFDACVLQVGYGDDLATIFQGEIKQKIGNGLETPTDTYFKILAAEGQKAYSYGIVNKTLASGHTFRDQVDACLEALKPYDIKAGYIADLGSAKMPRGRAMFGMVREHLRAICRATNTTWSIEGTQLQILKNTDPLPGQTIVLNSKTGLIGMPVQTLDGIHARCLLNPRIKAGCTVQINEKDIQQAELSLQNAVGEAQKPLLPSIATDGLYTVWYTEHTGDSRGTEWYTDMVCIAQNQGSVPPATAQMYTTSTPTPNAASPTGQ